ncbi:hypothetical protein M0Q97_06505 [Candidatus Dojkabacteria bacterium]|jgi:hypothetical protein|nr:hypothetical protein [Candidatus Dojkabacteria bacterium]
MKKYDNFIKVDKFKCLSDGVKWKLNIVEKTISEIDKYVDSIPLRKSKNYVNNLLINSKLGKMYKLYYDLKGEKTNKLPINKAIYDYENLFLTIENKKNDANSYFLEHLKNYIIFVIYFPQILKYRDAEMIKHFNIEFFDYLKGLENYKDKEIMYKQGLLNHYLFFATSHDEIRSYLLLDELNDMIKDFNHLHYDIFFSKFMLNKDYDEQFDKIVDFLIKKNYMLKEFFDQDYINPEGFWILDPRNKDEWNKKFWLNDNYKINFTGDFIEDYTNLVKKYKEYYK